jgi:hypothetical protein
MVKCCVLFEVRTEILNKYFFDAINIIIGVHIVKILHCTIILI